MLKDLSSAASQEGSKVEGLRIAKIDGDKVEVTTRPLSQFGCKSFW